MYDYDDGPLATMDDAHREWHRNAGVPIGQPCPFDACDPYAYDDRPMDGYDEEPEPEYDPDALAPESPFDYVPEEF